MKDRFSYVITIFFFCLYVSFISGDLFESINNTCHYLFILSKWYVVIKRHGRNYSASCEQASQPGIRQAFQIAQKFYFSKHRNITVAIAPAQVRKVRPGTLTLTGLVRGAEAGCGGSFL